MKKIFKISLFVFAIALAVACKPLSEQIEINGCELESFDGLSLGAGQLNLGTTLQVDGSNSSCRDISLSKFSAEIFSKSGKRVATVTYPKKKGEKLPTLHRRSTESVSIPLQVSFDNPLSALSLASMTLDDYSEKGYTVSYDCTFRSGCLQKRFTADKVPMAELSSVFDK